MKTGLPVHQFIAASNQNKIVPEYLKTGVYQPQPSIQTIANAMDVGNPNNFPRLLELFDSNYHPLSEKVQGISYSDEQIKTWIRDCYSRTGYLLDPHGATGYGSIKDLIRPNEATGIFLETAHPGKFNDEVERIVNQELKLPAKLEEFSKRTIQSEELSTDYHAFKDFLLNMK